MNLATPGALPTEGDIVDLSPVSPRVQEPPDLSRIKARAKVATASLGVRYGLVFVTNLVGAIVLSRLVGPWLWGVFAIAQVIYTGSQEILGRGVASYLIKKSGALSLDDLRTTFAVQHILGLGFLMAAIAITRPIAGWYGRPELVPLLLAAGFGSYVYAWRSLPLALLERNLDYAKVAGIEVLDAATFSLVAIGLSVLGHSIVGLSAAIALRSLLPTALAFWLRPIRPVLCFRWRSAATVADFGFFVVAGSLVNIAIFSVPALFVGKLAGLEALGAVQLAFSLYATWRYSPPFYFPPLFCLPVSALVGSAWSLVRDGNSFPSCFLHWLPATFLPRSSGAFLIPHCWCQVSIGSCFSGSVVLPPPTVC